VAVVSALDQSQPFALWQGDVNMRGNPTLATEIGEMILRIIEMDLSGIFHCCGGESATRLELAQTTAQVFGLDADLIQPSPPDAIDPASLAGIPVPKDTRLDFGSTASRLAYQPPDLVQALHRLRQQLETGQV
jgi:dTDP-4-dehydrorhamnose reductase